MTISKRVLLAVLCLVVAALPVAAAPSKPLATGTATLVFAGDELAASGTATLRLTKSGWYYGGNIVLGTMSVSCRALTPGGTYEVGLGGTTGEGGTTLGGVADRHGRLTLSGDWGWLGLSPPEWVTVSRVDSPTESVLVLSGDIVWK